MLRLRGRGATARRRRGYRVCLFVAPALVERAKNRRARAVFGTGDAAEAGVRKKVPTACACPTGVSVPYVPRSACIQRSRGRPAGTRAVGYHGTARGTRCPSAHARACSQTFSGTRPGPHEVGRTGSAGATYDAPHRVVDTVRREIHVGLLRRSPDHVRKTAATVDDARSTSP